MAFASTWRRGAARASAVTLLVPASIIIPLAVAQLGGGLRGLGAAGQLLHGPDVPALPSTKHARAQRPSGGAPAVALPIVRGGGTAAPPVTTPTSPGTTVTPAPPAPTTAPHRSPTATGVVPHPHRHPAHSTAPVAPAPQPAVPSSAAPAPAPPSPPPPAPDPVRSTGQAVAGAVGAAPRPVGAAGKDAVTTVLDIVDPPGH